MLGFVLLVPGLVGRVPMAVLAALMILAGLSAVDVREARSIWRTGGAARWSIVVTFLATLVLSIPLAVSVGVALSIVLYVASSASDVAVRALVRRNDGRFAEAEPPTRLPSEEVTVLDVYGSLFFAGAQTLREALPSAVGATRPAVVLRLRGRTRVGSTLIDVLDDYADDLRAVGGRLYLSGVHADVATQLQRAGKLEAEREVWVSPAGEVIGESTAEAIAQANAWLGRPKRPTKAGAS
jgi:SulP family sulfate permease